MAGWRYYFPDDEGADDAREIKLYRGGALDAEHAAQLACELDYARHDGWERGETRFQIAVISPDGDEHRFEAWHEPSVEHRVLEAT